MFERAVTNRLGLENDLNLSEYSDESDEEESDSSSSGGEENRPMSVHDMRRRAAEAVKRPESAVTTSSANANPGKLPAALKNLPRHTVF